PSGHAMSSFSFYGYLYHIFQNVYFRIFLIFIIIFIGISRPYLAVHFIEDIALGWIIGFTIVVLVIKYSNAISNLWKRINFLKQVLLTVGLSLIWWILTFYINGGDISSQPLPFVGHLGFILGLVIGLNLEQKTVNFNPKSKTITIKIIRWLITIVLVMTPLILLDEISKVYWSEQTYLSHLIHYVSYTLSGFLGIYIAPFLFLRLNLVDYFRE
ncbi:MAG: phosphatase PAP2 family protein, partial [Winogradskyella sp.]